MAVTPVSNQAAIASQASLVKSLSTANVSTTVTSNDPTVLAKQAQQLSSQLTQLQSQGGSSQEIQKIQQAVQAIQSKIQQQAPLADEKEAGSQSSSSVKPFTRGIDTKA